MLLSSRHVKHAAECSEISAHNLHKQEPRQTTAELFFEVDSKG